MLLDWIFENVPYWLVQVIVLLLFSVIALFIFKIRSKTAVFFSITLLALITFYLLDFASMHYCVDIKSSFTSEEGLQRVGSYCAREEVEGVTSMLAFFKAFVLWFVALMILLFKSKSTDQKID